MNTSDFGVASICRLKQHRSSTSGIEAIALRMYRRLHLNLDDVSWGRLPRYISLGSSCVSVTRHVCSETHEHSSLRASFCAPKEVLVCQRTGCQSKLAATEPAWLEFVCEHTNCGKHSYCRNKESRFYSPVARDCYSSVVVPIRQSKACLLDIMNTPKIYPKSEPSNRSQCLPLI
jgi:hypothetical protein